MVNGTRVQILQAQQAQLRGQVIKTQQPVRIFTEPDQDAFVAEQKRIFIASETQKINTEIQNFQNDIRGLQERRQSSIDQIGGIGSQNRGQIRDIDDQIATAKRNQRELSKRKSRVQEGFSFEQLSSEALSQSRFDKARLTFEKAQREEAQRLKEEKPKQDEPVFTPAPRPALEAVGSGIGGGTLFRDPTTGRVSEDLFTPFVPPKIVTKDISLQTLASPTFQDRDVDFESQGVFQQGFIRADIQPEPGTAVFSAAPSPAQQFEKRQQRLRTPGGGAGQLGFFQSLKTGLSDLFTGGLIAQGGDIAGLQAETKGQVGFGKALERAEGFKKDDPFFDITPQFGTIRTDVQPAKTIGQRQADIEIEREFKLLFIKTNAQNKQQKLNNKLQERLDDEKITIEEARKEQQQNADKINRDSKKKVEKLFRDNKDLLIDPFERKQTFRQAVDLGFDIVAITAGSLISPAIPLVFFGIKAIEKAPDADTFGERASVGLDLGFAAFAGASALSKTGLEAFQATAETTLKELEAAKIFSQTRSVKVRGGDILSTTRGTQATGLGKIVTFQSVRTKVDPQTGIFFTEPIPGGGFQRLITADIPFRTIPFRGFRSKLLTVIEEGEIRATGIGGEFAKDINVFIGAQKAQRISRVGVISEIEPTFNILTPFAKLKPETIFDSPPSAFIGVTKKQRETLIRRSFEKDPRDIFLTGSGAITPEELIFRQADITKVVDLSKFSKPSTAFPKPTRGRPPKVTRKAKDITGRTEGTKDIIGITTDFKPQVIPPLKITGTTATQISQDIIFKDVTTGFLPTTKAGQIALKKTQQDLQNLFGGVQQPQLSQQQQRKQQQAKLRLLRSACDL